MGCCKDEGMDPLWCERRAMGKWHCKDAEDVVKSGALEVLWNEGEFEDV